MDSEVFEQPEQFNPNRWFTKDAEKLATMNER
jgi:hypothetical protein